MCGGGYNLTLIEISLKQNVRILDPNICSDASVPLPSVSWAESVAPARSSSSCVGDRLTFPPLNGAPCTAAHPRRPRWLFRALSLKPVWLLWLETMLRELWVNWNNGRHASWDQWWERCRIPIWNSKSEGRIIFKRLGEENWVCVVQGQQRSKLIKDNIKMMKYI